MKKLLILAALIAAPAFTSVAHAEPAKPLEIKVSAIGLDLSNPADAAVMIARLETAVRPNCVAPGFATRRSTSACIRDVVRDAVKGMQIPQLTAALETRFAPQPVQPAITLAQR